MLLWHVRSAVWQIAAIKGGDNRYQNHLTVNCTRSKTFFLHKLYLRKVQPYSKRYLYTPKNILCNTLWLYNNTINLFVGKYAACGFQVRLERKQMQYIVQVHIQGAKLFSFCTFYCKISKTLSQNPFLIRNFFSRFDYICLFH